MQFLTENKNKINFYYFLFYEMRTNFPLTRFLCVSVKFKLYHIKIITLTEIRTQDITAQ